MVCSSGVAFDPLIAETRHTFDVAGLYNGLFVMRDRQTGSIWTHYDGTVLEGSLAGTGTQLQIEPVLHFRWREWLERYPETLVLPWDDRFADRYSRYEPGEAGLGPEFQRSLLDTDDRLPENELIVGVDTGSASKAYLIDEVDELSVINDEVGGVPLLVVIDPGSRFGIAYAAALEGSVRHFSVDGGELLDDTGARWSLAGSGDGGQLRFVTSFVTEWYGWAAYHPDTSIYDW